VCSSVLCSIQSNSTQKVAKGANKQKIGSTSARKGIQLKDKTTPNTFQPRQRKGLTARKVSTLKKKTVVSQPTSSASAEVPFQMMENPFSKTGNPFGTKGGLARTPPKVLPSQPSQLEFHLLTNSSPNSSPASSYSSVCLGSSASAASGSIVAITLDPTRSE
jgi:hypothetical protein